MARKGDDTPKDPSGQEELEHRHQLYLMGGAGDDDDMTPSPASSPSGIIVNAAMDGKGGDNLGASNQSGYRDAPGMGESWSDGSEIRSRDEDTFDYEENMTNTSSDRLLGELQMTSSTIGVGVAGAARGNMTNMVSPVSTGDEEFFSAGSEEMGTSDDSDGGTWHDESTMSRTDDEGHAVLENVGMEPPPSSPLGAMAAASTLVARESTNSRKTFFPEENAAGNSR